MKNVCKYQNGLYLYVVNMTKHKNLSIMNTLTIFYESGKNLVEAEAVIDGVVIAVTDETKHSKYMRKRLTPLHVMTVFLKLRKILSGNLIIKRKHK